MTEANRDLSEVPALITERKRYEAWITALEARRESTPLHVFERVHGDYRTRLRRVAEQIASYRHAIEEERTNVDSRLSLLEAEERMRRDERAELELRSHVGELSGEEAVAAFNTVDEAVTRLVGEKEGLQSRISELDSLIEQADLPAEPAPAPQVAAPIAEPVAAPVAQVAPEPVVEETFEAPREEPVAARASAEATREPYRKSDQIEMSTPVAEAASGAAYGQADSGESNGAAGSTESASQSPRVSELRTPSGTFDELKFLHTVVGRTTSAGRDMSTVDTPRPKTANPGEVTAARTAAPRDSLPRVSLKMDSTGTPNRPSAAVEQTKTLKCSECGAQNYPTEWYCERCGAELAAL